MKFILYLWDEKHTHMEKNIYKIGKELFITSDEEIKEGDWCLDETFKPVNLWFYPEKLKGKIILTTDQDLIKDGVQAIDDEFLEWFVNNPSCEEVEIEEEDYSQKCRECGEYVKRGYICNRGCFMKSGNFIPTDKNIKYKIIIPKEEPKQIKCYCGHTITCDCGPLEETLEEVAKEWVNNRFTKQICGDESYPDIYASKEGIVESHILFAKWQQERMYSEEDMIGFAEFVATYLDKNRNVYGQMLHAKSKYDGAERTIDLLEQFKKK
jgi:hypothetical protein